MNLGNRWRCLVSFMPRPHSHWKSALSTHWTEHINHKWPFVTATDKRRENYCIDRHWKLRYRRKPALISLCPTQTNIKTHLGLNLGYHGERTVPKLLSSVTVHRISNRLHFLAMRPVAGPKYSPNVKGRKCDNVLPYQALMSMKQKWNHDRENRRKSEKTLGPMPLRPPGISYEIAHNRTQVFAVRSQYLIVWNTEGPFNYVLIVNIIC